MKTDPSDFEPCCAYCSKLIPSEASEAGIFVISGEEEEVDEAKRLSILQPVCLECAKERNLDEIMSDIMSDIINDGLKGPCCTNSEPLL